MGIYDRDYMREHRRMEAGPARDRRPEGFRASWWKRLKFKLWLLLHGRGGTRS